MKDVGKIFENKLNDGKKEPSESVWEKINTSLDTEKFRKKRILYSWLVGTGLISALVLFLAFNNESLLINNSPKQQDNIPVTNYSNSLTEPSTENAGEENDTKRLFEISKEAASNDTNEIGEKTSQFEILNKNPEWSAKEENSKIKSKIQQIGAEKKSQLNGSTDKMENKNFTVSKNYYYYNSKTGKTIVTQNKNVIDSLISEKYKPLDSVTTPKTEGTRQ